MGLQLVDLNLAPTLEVLGVDCSAERKQPGSSGSGNTHGQDGPDSQIIRASPSNRH